MYELVQNTTFDRLDNIDCINAYAQPIQTKRRNLLLVAEDTDYLLMNGTNQYGHDYLLTTGTNEFRDDSHVYWHTSYQGDVTEQDDVSSPSNAFYWMCSSIENQNCLSAVQQIKEAPSTWTISKPCSTGYCGVSGKQYVQMKAPSQYCLSEQAEQR